MKKAVAYDIIVGSLAALTLRPLEALTILGRSEVSETIMKQVQLGSRTNEDMRGDILTLPAGSIITRRAYAGSYMAVSTVNTLAATLSSLASAE